MPEPVLVEVVIQEQQGGDAGLMHVALECLLGLDAFGGEADFLIQVEIEYFLDEAREAERVEEFAALRESQQVLFAD